MTGNLEHFHGGDVIVYHEWFQPNAYLIAEEENIKAGDGWWRPNWYSETRVRATKLKPTRTD